MYSVLLLPLERTGPWPSKLVGVERRWVCVSARPSSSPLSCSLFLFSSKIGLLSATPRSVGSSAFLGCFRRGVGAVRMLVEGTRQQQLGLCKMVGLAGSPVIHSVIKSSLRLFTVHLHARCCVGAEDRGCRRETGSLTPCPLKLLLCLCPPRFVSKGSPALLDHSRMPRQFRHLLRCAA